MGRHFLTRMRRPRRAWAILPAILFLFVFVYYIFSRPHTLRSPPTLHGVHYREPVDHKHLPQILRDAIDFQFMTEQDSPAKCSMSCDGQTRELKPERSLTLIRTDIEDLAEELQFNSFTWVPSLTQHTDVEQT